MIKNKRTRGTAGGTGTGINIYSLIFFRNVMDSVMILLKKFIKEILGQNL
jgi:hypothetical protein